MDRVRRPGEVVGPAAAPPHPPCAGSQVDPLDYSLRRHYVDEFHQRQVASLPQGSCVLDLGGDRVRKRGLFDIDKYPLRTVYANLSVAKRPHVQADAARIPFLDGQFDAVICSELLEHVPEPSVVLAEAARVLRRGGVVLICAPFLHRMHGDPGDYGRYTDTYWLQVLARLGFSQVAAEKQGLFWSVIVDMLRDWVRQAAQEGRPRPALLRRALAGVVRWAWRRALVWDERAAERGNSFLGSFTTGFGVRAVKA